MPVQHLKRRNGRPHACEPCRTAKIRCDHNTPVCGRCDRTGLKCVYHPAPMTGSRAPVKAPKTRTVKASVKQKAEDSSVREESSSTPTIIFSPSVVSSHKSGVFRRPVSTFGTTKFNAVFAENQDSFQDAFSHATMDTSGSMGQSPDYPQPQMLVEDSLVTSERLRLGIEVLKRFPTKRTSDILGNYLGNSQDVWTSPKMILSCLAQVWKQYGDALEEPRTNEKLSQFAKDLFSNGLQPLPSPTSYEWQNWFLGPNLRWDMIGILFSFFGLMLVGMHEYDPVLSLPEQQGQDRAGATRKMKKCAEDCIQLCMEYDDNEVLVILSKNTWKIESILVGDESDQIRKGSGVVMSSFITIGLHHMPETREITPLSEYQTSLAASLYYLDKTESIFNARPPYMSRHYATWQYPLDLSEEDLYSGPEIFASAVKKLDVNGWNTDGQIYANTLLRTRCSLTKYWEELLEITLGVNPRVSCEHIDHLISEVNQLESSWPPQLQYSRIHNAADGVSILSPNYEYHVTRAHIDVLRCRFLLERLKFSRFQCSTQNLMDLSQESLSLVLRFWLKRDQWSQYSGSFDWLVVCYGIPCAGVLCVELLKSVKAPNSADRVSFSRSEVIRNLNLIVGYLDWIRPSDGNHDLCKKMMRVVKRVVDTVLEAPQTSNQPGVSTNPESSNYQSNSNPAFEIDLMSFGTMDDLNWLNSIDWTQGDWSDFNQMSSTV